MQMGHRAVGRQGKLIQKEWLPFGESLQKYIVDRRTHFTDKLLWNSAKSGHYAAFPLCLPSQSSGLVESTNGTVKFSWLKLEMLILTWPKALLLVLQPKGLLLWEASFVSLWNCHRETNETRCRIVEPIILKGDKCYIIIKALVKFLNILNLFWSPL